MSCAAVGGSLKGWGWMRNIYMYKGFKEHIKISVTHFFAMKTKMWRVCEDPFVLLRLWSEAVVPCEQFSRLDSKSGLVPWVTQHFTLYNQSATHNLSWVVRLRWFCIQLENVLHTPHWWQCIKRLLPPVCWQTKHLCGPWTSTVERLAPFWGGL